MEAYCKIYILGDYHVITDILYEYDNCIVFFLECIDLILK